MKKPDSNQALLARLLDQAYLEVFPTKTIADRLVHIPRHCFVGISCSPTFGLEPTIALVEQLKAQPDELLQGLQPQLGNPDLLIDGFHIFSFNAVERTERWRMETYNNLSG